MYLEGSRFVAQSYFRFQSDKAAVRVKTSKNLFSKHPHRPNAEQLAKAVQGFCPPNRAEIEGLHQALLKALVPQWEVQMRMGFNLALYGYGSKGRLIEDFVDQFLQDQHVFWFQAYTKNASLLDLLLQVASINGIGLSGVKRTVGGMAEEIARQLRRRVGMTVLVITHADAACMCSEDAWHALQALAICPQVRLVLTFEHINALNLMDSPGWARLNLLWHDATTMRPYATELFPFISRKSHTLDPASRWKGAQFVLTSLTRTARGIFRILAEEQIQQTDKACASIDHSDPECSLRNHVYSDPVDSPQATEWGWGMVPWYQKCQEQFLVSNEIAFRTQLAEFLDHELVKACGDRGQNGTDFYIPFERPLIEHLIELCQN